MTCHDVVNLIQRGGHAHPPFGMTLTQAIRDLFVKQSQMIFTFLPDVYFFLSALQAWEEGDHVEKPCLQVYGIEPAGEVNWHSWKIYLFLLLLI